MTPTNRVHIPWRDRHRNIARALQGGTELLAYAERRDVIEKQRALVIRGGKPVLAYTPFFQQLALVGGALDALKRFAGEVAAFVVETLLGAQRAPGTKVIIGHSIFSSAQPFRFPRGSRGLEDGADAVAATSPGTERFLRMLEALLETADPDELPLARNVVEQAIARRPEGVW